MCAPVLAAAATAAAAGGQIIGGLSARAQDNYDAQVASRNAQLVDAREQDAQQRATLDQQTLDRHYSALEGQQTAAMAANGVELGFGSAARVAEDSATMRDEDASALYANQYSALHGLDITASNDQAQAVAARQRGQGAFVKSLFDATGTALGGAAQYKRASG